MQSLLDPSTLDLRTRLESTEPTRVDWSDMLERPWLAHYDADVPPSLEYDEGTLLDYSGAACLGAAGPDGHHLQRSTPDLEGARRTVRRAGGRPRVAERHARRPRGGHPALLPAMGDRAVRAVEARRGRRRAEPDLHRARAGGPAARQRRALAIAMTRVYGRVKAVQSQTALERVVATNIKEYFPAHLALLFTLFKERKDGHRITLAAGDRVVEGPAATPRRHTPAADPRRARTTTRSCWRAAARPARPRAWSACIAPTSYAGRQIHAWTKSSFRSGRTSILLPLPLCHVYANVGGLGLGIVSGSPIALDPEPARRGRRAADDSLRARRPS